MTEKNLPPVEYLRKRLRYEPETGKLFWLDCEEMSKSWRTRWSEKEAFTSLDSHGYFQGKIHNTNIMAHRAIWAIYHGQWPEDCIDHINGIRVDNKIENLRVVTKQENKKNAAMRSDNTSGITGVYWYKSKQKWRAQIKTKGVFKSLGFFVTIEDAAAARIEAASKYGFSKRHGEKAE